MPAYNYFPATYQPYYYPQVQQQQTNNQSGILWVSNEQEAYSYPVAPNAAVALWDSSKPSVYIKQADASGKPTLKVYDLVERSQNAPAGVESQRGKDIPYALKSDMEALQADFNAIKGELKLLKAKAKKERVEDDE